ncbi:M48 family metallopeptidase [Novosphingobium sp. 9]|uniref:M48 family metallopeptidase n=1 Tax=Novosphingobium sp. 9 TaxID=2025349 RepID=UPI0021B6AA90|nr:SprT family zinc-dependent metalloprotease [Novosphingobium sp. 9]
MLDWLRRDPRSPQARQAETIEIDGRVLAIEVRQLAQARRMTMRLAPDGSAVRISVPRWVPAREAHAFARSRRDWLAGQLAKIPLPTTLADGATLHVRGEALVLRHDPAAPRRVRIADGILNVGGPSDSLESRLKRWLQAEARARVEPDLAHYCALAGQAVPALSLSGAQRRWGSCSSGGTIRINWRLIMAPDLVRRSVVAHEVAHLVHFDHSPAFHKCLADLFEGNVHHANRWLSEHGRSLYGPFG